MTVAAYIRVSSLAQNLATQRDAITRAAAARGDDVATWFVEKRSAKTLQREALDALRAAVRAGEVRRLYVFRLDRLTRSGIRDTLALLDELRGGGCEVVTTHDGFSLEGPGRDVIAAVMAWGAEMERLATNERIAAARERVERAGKKWGRPARGNDKLAEKARVLKVNGKSIRQIAVALKVPRSTVAAMVSEKGAYRPRRPGPKKVGVKKSEPRTS